MGKFKSFLERKDIVISGKRYGVDALGAMAQGLFASLLIGTIIATIGEQAGIQWLVDVGGFAKSMAGPAMAASIAYALGTPNLVLFSMLAVGAAANKLGGAGGPLAVYVVTIFASEFGKAAADVYMYAIVIPIVLISTTQPMADLPKNGIGSETRIKNNIAFFGTPNLFSTPIFSGTILSCAKEYIKRLPATILPRSPVIIPAAAASPIAISPGTPTAV